MKKKILVCLLLIVVMTAGAVPVFATTYQFKYLENAVPYKAGTYRVGIDPGKQVVGLNVLGGGIDNHYRVKVVQVMLKRQGCYNGYIDGSCGPQTKAAIRLFQTRQKAAGKYRSTIDGYVGPATMQCLWDANFRGNIPANGVNIWP